MTHLSNISGPADLKRLTVDEMNALSGEIREALIKKLSQHGGHCGPNLGMVEAIIAMHYVFNSPEDKLVFDVSHQSYVHKMLTGRAAAFLDSSRYDDVSGYTEPTESAHDHFTIGHTSTSVSLASGLAKGRDLTGGHENVIAIIGDGSLSGGEAFEGLDYAAELGTNFIVVVNDNQMSIAENHGGIYHNLETLRNTKGKAECNYFRAMGYDYIYVDRGNDIGELIKAFAEVKDTQRPVVVHINTLKGKGYTPAEQQQEAWHWHVPFDIESGESLNAAPTDSYEARTASVLLEAMRADRRVAAITAGVPTAMGFTKDKREEAGAQFIDVGIAEEHAVALASGMAKAGGKPVFGVYSTFIQRAYDQISQDLCINDNPATLLVFWGSLATMNDVTHLCHFDIPLLCNIPNLVYLAPTNWDEYHAMLKWSLDYTAHPVAIRVPVCAPLPATRPVPTDFSDLNRYEVVSRGEKVAVIGLGNYFALGEEVCALLKDKGISATLINPRYISGMDTTLLDSLQEDHSLVVTLEDGVLAGGFGEKIARHYAMTPMRVMCKGAEKRFVDRYDLNALLSEYRLTPEMIAEDIIAAL
ncbi:MAG: 1-deoxy-D-xylulose-5-phosphate synthase [Prevotellaceae bacterium]|nr:1-deoxy-D-xylulose-5-phosphate synthase [Prevotellaceae bacterium]